MALFIELLKRDRKWGERGRMSCRKRVFVPLQR